MDNFSVPSLEELDTVGKTMRILHQELITLGNEKERKEKQYKEREALLARILKLIKDGDQKGAMELFAPSEFQSLRDTEDALAKKTNVFNDLGFEQRRLSMLNENARIRLEAAKLGLL